MHYMTTIILTIIHKQRRFLYFSPNFCICILGRTQIHFSFVAENNISYIRRQANCLQLFLRHEKYASELTSFKYVYNNAYDIRASRGLDYNCDALPMLILTAVLENVLMVPARRYTSLLPKTANLYSTSTWLLFYRIICTDRQIITLNDLLAYLLEIYFSCGRVLLRVTVTSLSFSYIHACILLLSWSIKTF